jgi:hypothetical protein
LNISDAKRHIGQVCRLSWLVRGGEIREAESKIHDVMFVPLYGGFVITDVEDVRLDKILSFRALTAQGEETVIYDSSLPAADRAA